MIPGTNDSEMLMKRMPDHSDTSLRRDEHGDLHVAQRRGVGVPE
jgi:hypothetical protein